MNTGPVVCDLRAIQSPDHRGRGIGRWAYDFATALERTRPDLVSAYLLDPGWPPPGAADELLASTKVAFAGTSVADEALASARVYHCSSPFELGRPLSSVRPKAVDELGLAYSAVAYDLIPLRHPDEYLVHPGQRRRYGARLELLRCADAVLAISEVAANDVQDLLGIGADRCHVVGTGVSRHFVPPASREDSLRTLRSAMPELRDRFVLYPGGNDGRKNIEGLIAAFALLPDALLRQFQLVIVGDLPPLTANHYRHLARGAGVEDHLILTGFVSDERLVRLYQATDLFVFPSIAEGYGLPVAEALACGAVACVSDRPPVDALVRAAGARFDPYDRAAMADTMALCLTDERLRRAVSADAAEVVTQWDDVARRAGAVFDRLAQRAPRRWRPPQSRRVAVVSPFPPTPSGVAGYSKALVEAMERQADGGTAKSGARRLEIDCYADSTPGEPATPEPIGDREVGAARLFRSADALAPYDDVVYVLGNSEFHGNALASLRERPGVVIAHDVRLSGLMSLTAGVRGAVPGGLAGAIARAYPLLPAGIGSGGRLTEADRERYGVLLLRDVIEHTPRLLVSSETARRMAELDTGPEFASRLGVLPFAMSRLGPEEHRVVEKARADATDERAAGQRKMLVASFGIVDPGKRPGLVLDAFARMVGDGTDADLAFVGGVSKELAAELTDLSRELGIGERVRLTGSVSWEEYLRMLGRADVAVQLRSRFFGEASGAVSECMSAGVPTLVSDLGWMHELPDDAVCKVRHECTAAELAAEMRALLLDPQRRRLIGDAGRSFAEVRTFDVAAAALLSELSI